MNLGFSTTIMGRPSHFVGKIWAGYALDNPSPVHSAILLAQKCIERGLIDTSISYIPKRHSIRVDANNRWSTGQDIHAVVNNRTKNRFQFLPKIKSPLVQEIILDPGKHLVYLDGHLLTKIAVDKLATNDGFESADEFWCYFNRYTVGKLIWLTTPVDYKAIQEQEHPSWNPHHPEYWR